MLSFVGFAGFVDLGVYELRGVTSTSIGGRDGGGGGGAARGSNGVEPVVSGMTGSVRYSSSDGVRGLTTSAASTASSASVGV